MDKKTQDQIDELQALVDDETIPADERDFAKKEIAALKAEGDKKPVKEKPEPKEKPETAKKKQPSTKQKMKQREQLSFIIDGKKVSLNESDCWQRMKALADRLKKAKKANKEYRTKPITAKVAANLETTAKQSVEAVTQNRLDNNPADVVKGANKMEAAFEKLFEGFEQMSGKKIPAATRKAIMDLLSGIREDAKDAK